MRSSAIAQLLVNDAVEVTGSEMKQRGDLSGLEKLGIKIKYFHDKINLHSGSIPDIVLYSPAVKALDPNNPELLESKNLGITALSWQSFIGDYLNSTGRTGITVCGSEGKGTTAGILTMILKGTELDPLSILGAYIKNIENNKNSNIYIGRGKSYILEGDEYNRNFYNYHPSMNIMINFKYEHPETYKDFNEYQNAFFEFFNGMNGEKTLILRATSEILNFIKKYDIKKNHKIVLFDHFKDSSKTKPQYVITDHLVSTKGNSFKLNFDNKSVQFDLPILPGFIADNAVGAIIAALELGLDLDLIKNNILRFKGMVRRFDLFKTKDNDIIITDYGHSPESINTVLKEIRSIFKEKKVHLIFQPHLFSRTFNFFNEFVMELKEADKITLIDIYPARERAERLGR